MQAATEVATNPSRMCRSSVTSSSVDAGLVHGYCDGSSQINNYLPAC